MEERVEDPDFELLRKAMHAPAGDLRAFEELVARYQRRILANCKYLTRDEQYYEDLAQEVFVKAFFALRTFEGRSTFRSWLKRIKVNHCLNHMKKQATRQTQALEEEVAETFVAADERRDRVEVILNSLPDTLRIPLVMCDMDELSYEEIAAALGIGLSATKMRIKRGREQFRERYEAS
jgi:RNA polymerase sigma-70 factor, ECF subfamily